MGNVAGALGDEIDGVGDTLHLRVAQVDLGQFDQPADGEMRVRVDEPRRHGAAGKIDARRSRAGQGLDVVGRAHRDDFAVAYGYRLGDRITGVDRQDVSVHEDAVGGWFRSPSGVAADEDPKQQQHHAHGTPQRIGVRVHFQ